MHFYRTRVFSTCMSGARTTFVSLAFAINKLKVKTKWNRMPPQQITIILHYAPLPSIVLHTRMVYICIISCIIYIYICVYVLQQTYSLYAHAIKLKTYQLSRPTYYLKTKFRLGTYTTCVRQYAHVIHL